LVLAKSARLQFLIACVHIVLCKSGPIKRISLLNLLKTQLDIIPRNIIVCLAIVLSERSPLLLLLIVFVVEVLSAVFTVFGIADTTTAASDDLCIHQYTTVHI
jgi:hypothetical protein